MHVIPRTWIQILLFSVEMPISIRVVDDAVESISNPLRSLALVSAA